jgi:hypothetical protein
MVSDSEQRLIEAVERARKGLHDARAKAEEDGQHIDLLRRIRTFHQRVLFPIVQHKHHVVRHVGTVWLEEDIDPPHQLPRAIVHFDSISTASGAPHGYMTFHVAENGTTFVTRNYESPIKTTDVTFGKLEELTPETVGRSIDEFLTKALES